MKIPQQLEWQNEENDKIPDEGSEKNTETPKDTTIHIDDNKIDDDII